MTLTIELLCFLGSPFAPSIIHRLDQHKSIELYDYSVKNRMLFLYLQLLHEKNTHYFVVDYQKKKIEYLETVDAIARASRVLSNANIKHATYKTVRPYKSTTVDIDILVFGEGNNCMKSARILQEAGYEIITCGPQSITLRDPKINIGIDLYEHVAVSYITYIDKEKLIDYVTTISLSNGNLVKILKPEADLACIIAHSLIKEQMYTLSEYYTFIYYLKQMDIHHFIQIIKQNNLTSATRTHTAITALLHKVANGTIPKELQEILSSLGEDNFETTRLIRNSFKAPHKYHPITVAKSLLEITKGKKARESIAIQLFYMLDLGFSKDFVGKFINHVLRETY
jgi:hypothetical protein